MVVSVTVLCVWCLLPSPPIVPILSFHLSLSFHSLWCLSRLFLADICPANEAM